MEKAVQQAHGKAKLIARAADLNFVRIVSITESGSHSPEPMFSSPRVYSAVAEKTAPSTDPGVISFFATVHLEGEAK